MPGGDFHLVHKRVSLRHSYRIRRFARKEFSLFKISDDPLFLEASYASSRTSAASLKSFSVSFQARDIAAFHHRIPSPD